MHPSQRRDPYRRGGRNMFAHDHRRFTIFSVVTLLGLTVGPLAQAACPVEGIPPSQHPRDPVAQVLERQTTCPRSPAEFVDALKRLNVRMEPTLSSFAGFHNPAGGGFMIFEIASTEAGSAAPISIQRGDLLFGHFANVDGDAILSKRGGLAIELIAWDPDKQFYNFYDLAGGRWLYRGDSTGILDEVEH